MKSKMTKPELFEYFLALPEGDARHHMFVLRMLEALGVPMPDDLTTEAGMKSCEGLCIATAEALVAAGEKHYKMVGHLHGLRAVLADSTPF